MKKNSGNIYQDDVDDRLSKSLYDNIYRSKDRQFTQKNQTELKSSQEIFKRRAIRNQTLNQKLNQNYVMETDQIEKSVDDYGKKNVNQYQILQLLGEGSFGKVKLAYDKINKKYVAIKQMSRMQLQSKRVIDFDDQGQPKHKTMLDNFQKEVAIMKKLKHQNVIQLFEVIQTQTDDKIYLIEEYADQGQIADWNEFEEKFSSKINVDDEKEFKTFIRQFAKGIHYLHKNEIIHRDIKPQNILMTKENQIKISDFGLAQLIQEGKEIVMTEGTLQFMAPEFFRENQDNSVRKKADLLLMYAEQDIWSMGVTLYCLIYQILPFSNSKQSKLFEQIAKGDFSFPKKPKISSDLKSLIKKMMEKNPKKRLTMDKLLENKWLNKGFKISLKQEINDDYQQRENEIRQKQKLKDPIFTITLIKILMKTVIKHFLYNRYVKKASIGIKYVSDDFIQSQNDLVSCEQNLNESVMSIQTDRYDQIQNIYYSIPGANMVKKPHLDAFEYKQSLQKQSTSSSDCKMVPQIRIFEEEKTETLKFKKTFNESTNDLISPQTQLTHNNSDWFNNHQPDISLQIRHTFSNDKSKSNQNLQSQNLFSDTRFSNEFGVKQDFKQLRISDINNKQEGLLPVISQTQEGIQKNTQNEQSDSESFGSTVEFNEVADEGTTENVRLSLAISKASLLSRIIK